MSQPTSAGVLVAMPGTGSDADYVRRAFASAAVTLGVELIAPQPTVDLVRGYRRVLDDAAVHGPILVGGVSIGASIATNWAVDNPGRCAGVLAALPPWSGRPDGSVAAASAAATAAAFRRDGLRATVDAMVAGSPAWLATELSRSWQALFPGLIEQLDAAASYRGPTPAALRSLSAPLAITAAADDPIHPIDVAREWARSAQRATITELSLAQWGASPALLGDSCARGWLALTEG